MTSTSTKKKDLTNIFDSIFRKKLINEFSKTNRNSTIGKGAKFKSIISFLLYYFFSFSQQ